MAPPRKVRPSSWLSVIGRRDLTGSLDGFEPHDISIGETVFLGALDQEAHIPFGWRSVAPRLSYEIYMRLKRFPILGLHCHRLPDIVARDPLILVQGFQILLFDLPQDPFHNRSRRGLEVRRSTTPHTGASGEGNVVVSEHGCRNKLGPRAAFLEPKSFHIGAVREVEHQLRSFTVDSSLFTARPREIVGSVALFYL